MQTQQEEKKTLLSNLKKKRGFETWALQGGGEQKHKLRLKNFLKTQTVLSTKHKQWKSLWKAERGRLNFTNLNASLGQNKENCLDVREKMQS